MANGVIPLLKYPCTLRRGRSKIRSFLFMSVRFRNGKLYYRKTIRDSQGKRHWLERSKPIDIYADRLSKEEVVYVFKRFPEGHTAHVPLALGYYCKVPKEAAYEALESDFDLPNYIWHSPVGDIHLSQGLVRLLTRHIDRKHRLSIILETPPSPYLSTVKKSQVGYLGKALQKEGIHWTWGKWVRS